ncbi:acetamidase/formamidase family protein [Cereibacter johrii]|uniref:acetamidase/formamidase family protein n=1 Tax=Cereibacter johrii TaxID=445629 RepID=UPI0008478EDD|nr:acetamidase/formamidase family protein [Cereibacter johrii]ODM43367.1 acetamidase [Cereibacter johrii]
MERPLDPPLPASPATVRWGHLDPAAAPVLQLAPGERAVIETLSGGPRNLPPEGHPCRVLASHRAVMEAQVPHLGPHMLTGPVHVAGAEPGDRLVVEIEEIALAQDWGWSAIEPGFGIFPDLAPAYESLVVPIDRARRSARLPWGPEVALAPFFGILAVAPPPEGGTVSSVPPGPFGGNVDNRFFRQGARISFPVFCPGALFFAGDGHALQGDGEVCDTALETALNGRFRFTLEKGTAPAAPEIELCDLIVTMGFHETLDGAARDATARMLDWICAHTGLTRTEAWRHASLCADLRITQVVNGQKGVHCVLDRRSLIGARPA